MRLGEGRKLLLLFTVALVAGIVLVGFIIEARLRTRLTRSLEEEILTLARVIGKVMPDTDDTKALDAFCREYADTALVRVTIVRTDGRVAGESYRREIATANHLTRPEVRDALAGSVGFAVRRSATLGIDMLYVATLTSGKKDRVLRLAMPMKKVRALQNEVMQFFSLILYAVPAAAVVLSLVFARLLSRWE